MKTRQRPRAQGAKQRHSLPHTYGRAPWGPPPENCQDTSATDPQTFFASAIHDLKTPLTGIALWVDTLEMLEPRLSAAGRPETVALLDQALDQLQTLVRRSIHLVDDVMDVVRLRAGRPSPFTPGEVDLVALVREALAGWGAERKHVIRFESGESELWGWWDGDRLTRLVNNLVDNAIKYSPAGQPVTLRVAQDIDGGRPWAVLQVEDRGIGIPAAELPQIFEPFHRAHNVTGTVAGNGLGLWGCRAIVEQHGGTVTVASREGEGTSFTVRLPLRS